MSSFKSYFGFFCAIIGAMAYGMNPLFAKLLMRDGMDVPSILLCRFSTGAILMALTIFCHGGKFNLPLKNFIFCVINGVLMSLSALYLFKSFEVMDVGLASTLLFTYPIIVAVMMSLFFHEKADLSILIAIGLSLAGVAVLNGVGRNFGSIPLNGFIYVMLSSLTYAFYMGIVKVSPLRNTPSDTLTFWVLISGLFTFLFQLNWGRNMIWPSSGATWTLIVVMGFITIFISLLLTAIAIKSVGATPTAILGALEPLTAIFIGIFAFDEKLTVKLCAGMVLIGLASIIVVLRPAGHKKPNANRGRTPPTQNKSGS